MPNNKKHQTTAFPQDLIFSILATTLSVSFSIEAVAGTIELEPTRDIWTTSVYPYDGVSAHQFSGIGGGLNNDTLQVGGWGDEYRSLMQFDLSGISSPVTSATLHLYNMSNGATSGIGVRYPVSMQLDAVTSDWDWTTNTIDSGTLDQERLWWDDKPSFTTYEVNLDAPELDNYWSWDITALVNDQVNGVVPNYGIQLRPEATNQNQNYFASSENSNEDWRPKLVLETSRAGPDCGSVNFADSVSLAASGPTMSATFSPSNGCTLQEVAGALGYDHFNWVQVIKQYDGLLYAPLSIPPFFTPINFATPFLDPPDGGYIGRPADSLPYYYDEGPGFEEGYSIEDNTAGAYFLQFNDTPRLGTDSIPGGIMSFTTSLVGVIEDDIWAPEFTFDWVSDFRLDEGGILGATRDLDTSVTGTGGIFDIRILSDPLAVTPEVRQLWVQNGANIPVPAPQTLALVAIGLFGFNLWSKRRGED